LHKLIYKIYNRPLTQCCITSHKTANTNLCNLTALLHIQCITMVLFQTQLVQYYSSVCITVYCNADVSLHICIFNKAAGKSDPVIWIGLDFDTTTDCHFSFFNIKCIIFITSSCWTWF